jgi:hypothetical protein
LVKMVGLMVKGHYYTPERSNAINKKILV